MRENMGQCQYSVDVSEWYDRRRERLEESDVEIDLTEQEEDDLWEFADGFLNADGKWECYRRTRPGENYCLFHAHESDDGIEHAASPGQVLRDIVNGDTENRRWNEEFEGLWEVPRKPTDKDDPFTRDEFKHRERQFIGARLGDVRLSYERLDGPNSYPIDLRLAHADSLDLYGAHIGATLSLRGFEQAGGTITDTDYRSEDDTDEEYGIDLKKTEIEGGLSAKDARSTAGVRVRELTAAYVRFDRAVIDGPAIGAYLNTTTLSFKWAIINGKLDIPITTSRDSVILRGAHVDGEVNLARTNVKKEITLTDAEVGGGVVLEDVETGQSMRLNRATVTGTVSIKSDVGGSIELGEALVRSAEGMAAADEDLTGGDAGETDVDDGGEMTDEEDHDGYIDIYHTEVANSLRINGVEIETDLRLRYSTVRKAFAGADGVTIGGTVSINSTQIKSVLSLGDVRNSYGAIHMNQTEIDGGAGISGQVLDGGLTVEETTVESGFGFDYAWITGDLTLKFVDADFGLEFRNLAVAGSADISDVSVSGGYDMVVSNVLVYKSLSIDDAEFNGDFEFNSSTVFGSLSMDDIGVSGEFFLNESIVLDSVKLSDVAVTNGYDVKISRTEISGSLGIKDAEFDGDALFSSSSASSFSVNGTDVAGELLLAGLIDGPIDLTGTTASGLTIETEFAHPAVSVVKMEGTAFDSVRLDATSTNGLVDESPVYDLRTATVGQFDIEGAGGFEQARFLKTTFDGFVFSEHREQLRAIDWQVHQPREGGYEDIAIVSQTLHPDADGWLPAEREGPVFEIAGDVVGACVRRTLREEFGGDLAEVETERGPNGETVQLVDLEASMVDAYLNGLGGRSEIPHRAGGDPFSTIVSRLGGRWAPSPGHTTEETWTDLAEERLEEISMKVREEVGLRLRRARELPYSPVYLLQILDIQLRGQFSELDADPQGPEGTLPKDVDIYDGSPGPVTPLRLATAVLVTFALRPSTAEEVAKTAGNDAIDPIDLSTGGAVRVRAIDSIAHDRVAAAVSRVWEIATGPDATPFEMAVNEALVEGAEAIVVTAAAFEKDRRWVADLGLDAPPDGGGNDDPSRESAISDALNHSMEVFLSDCLLQELRMENPPSHVWRYLDSDVHNLARSAEMAVARDLADYRTALETNNELEATYALAKNGASDAGDETAAGNFFQREAGYARRQHWQRFRDSRTPDGNVETPGGDGEASEEVTGSGGDESTEAAEADRSEPAEAEESEEATKMTEAESAGLISIPAVPPTIALVISPRWLLSIRTELRQFGRWLGNVFLWLTMGYGEKPTRVLLFSAAIIGTFTLAYEALNADVAPVAGVAILGRLVFSFDVFVTLALGEPAGVGDFVRSLAVLEGFMGVFVIGMFVVTVTRAIHR